jgi:hypothetical protein
MCKTIPRTLQAALRWQVSGFVMKFVRKLSGLADIYVNKSQCSVHSAPWAAAEHVLRRAMSGLGLCFDCLEALNTL